LNTTNYWPFFLTALFPSLVALIGILVNKHDLTVLRTEMRSGFSDIRAEFRNDVTDLRNDTRSGLSDVSGQIQHLVDLHINHEGRIAGVEERTKKP
jgi:hypothetical protein